MTSKGIQLSFKQKLLLGITLSIFIVFGVEGVVVNWLIQERLHEQVLPQMEVNTLGIQVMVRGLVMSFVKSHVVPPALPGT